MNKEEHSILAAYAVYQELYETNSTSPYTVLSYFLKYIIYKQKMTAFTVSEISPLLKKEFDFLLPDAVIASTLKNIKELKRENKQYSLTEEMTYPHDLYDRLNEAQKYNTCLLNGLYQYIENENQCILTDQQKNDLERAFRRYLLDRKITDPKTKQDISAYILHISTNNKLKIHMDLIRAGSVLYTGLQYGMDNIARKRTNLTLFLATEIMFDLIGYNGEIFQSLALDMIQLIKEYNQGGMYIKLRFFSITKQEINDFFASAEQVVLRPHLIEQNVAMKSIVRGCSSKADIIAKKADFFYKLQYSYSIVEDDFEDYYAERYNIYNLEKMEINGQEPSRDLTVISHINKRRHGRTSKDYFRCGYLFITETNNILNLSRAYSAQNGDVQYAINMNSFTNLVWFKLNKGFGSQSRPANLDTVVKARIILSKIVSDGVFGLYEKSKKEYSQGVISIDVLAARIVALKEKQILPEEITEKNLEENLNFTEEHIDRYREDYNKKAEIIEDLKQSMEYMKTERERLEQERDRKNQIIKQKDNELEKVTRELKEYRDIDEQKRKRKQAIKYYCKFFVIRFGIFGGIFIALYVINSLMPIPHFDILSTAFSISTVIIPTVLTFMEKNSKQEE